MNRYYKVLMVLLGPIFSVVLRIPFVFNRESLYAFDPYRHLYYSRAWLSVSGWPLLNTGDGIMIRDYTAWPGVHIFVATLSSLSKMDPMQVMMGMPLVILFVLDLALVLILIKRTNLWFATLGGVSFGLADHVFYHTQYFIHETLALFLIMVLIMNELKVRSHSISFLILTCLLIVHHLSFLMAIIFWLLITGDRLHKVQVLFIVMILIEAVVFWEFALQNTGSFPDITNNTGGFSPALVLSAIIIFLSFFKWARGRIYSRYIEVHKDISFFDLLGKGNKKIGLPAVALGVTAIVVATSMIYLPALANLSGTGLQPAKILVAVGIFLFLRYAPMIAQMLGILTAFIAAFLLFVLNPVLFDFLPLKTRFLVYVYFAGFLMMTIGFYKLSKRYPRHMKVILLSLVLFCSILYLDDHLRCNKKGAERFEFTHEDLDFAETIGDITPPNATIVTPLAYSAMVFGISERRTEIYPIEKGLENGSYERSIPFFEELAREGPVYLVMTSKWKMYIWSGDGDLSEEDVAEFDASFSLVSDRFEFVVQEDGHRLYRFKW